MPVIDAATPGPAGDCCSFFYEDYPGPISGGAYSSPTARNASSEDKHIAIDAVLFAVVDGIRPAGSVFDKRLVVHLRLLGLIMTAAA